MNVSSSTFLRTISRATVLAAVLALGALATAPLQAGVISGATTGAGDPNGSIGARIRWGASGFEAAIRRGAPVPIANQNFATLNPTGTPIWQLNTPYDFQVTWAAATGAMGLSIDFDGNNAFGTCESISHVFSDRIGWGFERIQISGNESGNARRSSVSNLLINGDTQSALTPNGTLLDTYYRDSSNNLLSTITINGTFTMTQFAPPPPGNDERPSWNFSLRAPGEVPAVPEPASFVLWAVGFAGIGVIRRRRSSRT